jgi:transcriptional regulator with XRE-family HTH domain
MTQTALTEKQSLYRISGKLRKIRREKDLTQQTVADEMGIGVQLVSKIESGTNFTYRSLFKFLNYYKITQREFFSDID